MCNNPDYKLEHLGGQLALLEQVVISLAQVSGNLTLIKIEITKQGPKLPQDDSAHATGIRDAHKRILEIIEEHSGI